MTISCLPIANSTLSAEPVRTCPLDSTRYRNYHPTLGRWIQRDAAEDGLNAYGYVDANPVAYSDQYGLWKSVPGRQHVYEAEDGDINLYGLLAKVAKGGASPGWQYCLWGVYMKDPNIYPEVVAGDCFDASYFEVGSSAKFVGAIAKSGEVGTGYTYAAAAFYKAPVYASAQAMALAVKKASGEGKTPLKRTVFIGHGGSGNQLVSAQFGPDDLVAASTWPGPSFNASTQHIGPPQCWFAWDGEVRLVTCYGAHGQLQKWAAALSPQATVFGATGLVKAEFGKTATKEYPRMTVEYHQYQPEKLDEFEATPAAWTSTKGTRR